MSSALPPKADLPPDLRTTPVVRLLENARHRGLARRLVAVRRGAVFTVIKSQCPHPLAILKHDSRSTPKRSAGSRKAFQTVDCAPQTVGSLRRDFRPP